VSVATPLVAIRGIAIDLRACVADSTRPGSGPGRGSQSARLAAPGRRAASSFGPATVRPLRRHLTSRRGRDAPWRAGGPAARGEPLEDRRRRGVLDVAPWRVISAPATSPGGTTPAVRAARALLSSASRPSGSAGATEGPSSILGGTRPVWMSATEPSRPRGCPTHLPADLTVARPGFAPARAPPEARAGGSRHGALGRADATLAPRRASGGGDEATHHRGARRGLSRRERSRVLSRL